MAKSPRIARLDRDDFCGEWLGSKVPDPENREQCGLSSDFRCFIGTARVGSTESARGARSEIPPLGRGIERTTRPPDRRTERASVSASRSLERSQSFWEHPGYRPGFCARQRGEVVSPQSLYLCETNEPASFTERLRCSESGNVYYGTRDYEYSAAVARDAE